jgi:hypothetical protein
MLAEVHFQSKEQASCVLATTWTGVEALRNEIVILSFFAHRQIFNLGCDWGQRTAQMISGLRPPDFKGAGIIRGGSYQRAPALLASHPGPAPMRFIAKLTDNNFKLDAKGFGFFGTEIQFYAPMSVAVLTQFLAGRHQGDQAFLSALQLLLANVRMTAEAGLITMKSQTQLALFNAFDALTKASLMEDSAE